MGQPELALDRKYAPNPRPELERYVVATRNAQATEGWKESLWPRDRQPEIETARMEYDAGIVELCHWRDGDLIHLCKIPRVEPDKRRRKWFTRDYWG